ncbi:MAG: DEAD/DEAH box helicase [Gammaproteobacteria bacterium]|nr:DEAD/DEAH box helicase [Gammaproteobacteria bacterium]
MKPNPLAVFHPEIAAWMYREHGEPTPIQRDVWPLIASGAHVLASAPTGSGKTLCAFLWALDRLLTGAWPPGATRVLYVSPLKALNNDIRRNLLLPLAQLRQRFAELGLACPELQVATRSGDTPAEERQRMTRQPPEILITTPESLNLLLASKSGRSMLTGVRTLITDEVHAIAGNRRGVWLAAAAERLVDLAGEYQRVALSATVRPLDVIANWVGGYAANADGDPAAHPRPVRVVSARERPRLDLRIEALEADRLPEDGGLDALSPIARAIAAGCERNRSTLVFCNSRQLAEKLAFRINDHAGSTLAWAHHGSLARELRLTVEQRLKEGRLRAIVATSSLEMGIDIGSLDEVVLVQSPPTVTSTLQRIGRAGHGVGETSRAVLHPTHPHDLLEATAALHCAAEGDIESIRPLAGCLDVLAQIIIASLLAAPESADNLYAQVCRAMPYRQLPRAAFDAVVDMLTGRHAGSRIRELRPRIHRDPDSGKLVAGRGAALAFYASGGMIPDRGYFQLRHAHSQVRIGELDEEFVWENGPGRAFSLGSQQWRVQRVTHNDVFVLPAPEASHAPPFWRSEERERGSHLSTRLAEMLEGWESALKEADSNLGPGSELEPLDAGARTLLRDHLLRQRRHTGTALPHRHHLLAERIHAGPGGAPSSAGQLVLHTLAGARVNRPWALALEAAFSDRFGDHPEIHAGNDALVIQLEVDTDPHAILALVTSANVDTLLERRLTGSGFFGARFRECAGRALLLPRRRPGERQPLWLNRLQSQRLLGRLKHEPAFPILIETWRSCLEDEFELPELRRLLDELSDGIVSVTVCDTASPSPFAAQLARTQINRYMYADDQPRQAEDASRPALLDELLEDGKRRPRLEAATIEQFLRRRRRLEPGWAPTDALDLMDWIGERRLLEAGELEALQPHMPASEWLRAQTFWTELACERGRWITLIEDAPILAALAPELRGSAEASGNVDADTRLEWLLAWLSAQPPLTLAQMTEAWPGPGDILAEDVERLVEDGHLIRGALVVDDSAQRLCLRSLFEIMLRQQRARRRHLHPLPGSEVADFLLDWQRVGAAADILDAMEPLRGLPLPADRWESFVLPARLGAQRPAELDRLLTSGDLILYGDGPGRVGFALPEEIAALMPHVGAASAANGPELTDTPAPASPMNPLPQSLTRPLAQPAETPLPNTGAPPELSLPAGARLPFRSLVEACSDDARRATEFLWQGIWRGELTLDSFEAVRRGIAWKYSLPALSQADAAPLPKRSRRSLRQRLQARVQGYPGHFAALPASRPGDGLDALEHARERARMLLDRYGVVCPDLCRREARGMTFSGVFRALRWLELSGEVVGGWFLEGLGGPQFALPEAVETIRDWQREAAPPRWLHAQDPASPCGLGLPLPGLPLPAARSGNELVLGAGRVLLTYGRGAGELHMDSALDAGLCSRTLAAWSASLALRPGRQQRLVVTQINGEPARRSAALTDLKAHFHISADHRALTLQSLTVEVR